MKKEEIIESIKKIEKISNEIIQIKEKIIIYKNFGMFIEIRPIM